MDIVSFKFIYTQIILTISLFSDMEVTIYHFMLSWSKLSEVCLGSWQT